MLKNKINMKRNSRISIQEIKRGLKLERTNQIWYAIMKMDSDLLYRFLENDIIYEDIGKTMFIEKLAYRFNEFRMLGDTELLLDLEYCKGCNCNKPICKFIGNVSSKHFALFFEYKNNEISDIYHCHWYDDLN